MGKKEESGLKAKAVSAARNDSYIVYESSQASVMLWKHLWYYICKRIDRQTKSKWKILSWTFHSESNKIFICVRHFKRILRKILIRLRWWKCWKLWVDYKLANLAGTEAIPANLVESRKKSMLLTLCNSAWCSVNGKYWRLLLIRWSKVKLVIDESVENISLPKITIDVFFCYGTKQNEETCNVKAPHLFRLKCLFWTSRCSFFFQGRQVS